MTLKVKLLVVGWHDIEYAYTKSKYGNPNTTQLVKYLRVLFVKLSNKAYKFYTGPATSLRQAAHMTLS